MSCTMLILSKLKHFESCNNIYFGVHVRSYVCTLHLTRSICVGLEFCAVCCVTIDNATFNFCGFILINSFWKVKFAAHTMNRECTQTHIHSLTHCTISMRQKYKLHTLQCVLHLFVRDFYTLFFTISLVCCFVARTATIAAAAAIIFWWCCFVDSQLLYYFISLYSLSLPARLLPQFRQLLFFYLCLVFVLWIHSHLICHFEISIAFVRYFYSHKNTESTPKKRTIWIFAKWKIHYKRKIMMCIVQRDTTVSHGIL